MKTASATTALALALAVSAPFAANAADAYVQATRTSGSAGHALVTDYYVNPKTKIVVDFQYEDVSNDGRLFGVYRLGTSVGFYRNANAVDGVSTPFVLENSGAQVGMMVADTDRHVATFDFSKAGTGSSIAAVDGTVQWSGGPRAATTATATHPLVIFGTVTANGSHGTVGYFSSAKIYSFQIYEDDALVRDYVPAARDGKHGLYDRVGGLFLVDGIAGTDLGYGGDLLALDDAPYVESSGSQAINTGIYMDNTTKIEIDFALTETAQSGSVAGAWNFTGFNRLCFPYLNGGQFKYAWGGANDDTGGNWAFLAGPAQDTLRHRAVFDAPAQRLSLVGVSSRYYNTYAYDYDNATPALYPLMLCDNPANAAGTSTGSMASKTRIYGARIWQGGELVRDLTPAVKAGVTGLWDRVTGHLFSDYDRVGSGAGSALSASASIPEVDDDPYVESDGTAWLSTGVFMDSNKRFEIDFATTATGQNSVFAGAWATDGYKVCAPYINGGSFKLYNGSAWSFANVVAENTMRHTISIDARGGAFSFITGATTNKVIAASYSETSFPWPLALFAAGTNAEGTDCHMKSKGRIYGVRIYDGGELVHDWVPYVKQDVVGLADRQNSNAFLAPVAGTLTSGGAGIAGEKDAYVQAVRTSGSAGMAINTGYYVKPTTKFVVDFQYDDTGNDGRLFGSYNPKASRVGLYCNSGQKKFTFDAPGSQLYTLGFDTKRHVATLDYTQTGTGSSVATGGVAGWTGGPDAAVSAQGTNPLILFGTHTGSVGYYASAKIYSFRIYEGALLVHEYLPYRNGDTVSFYDTVDKVVLANNAGTSTAFGYGGKGVDGAERWLKPLPATATVSKGSTATLTAAASGAQSYRWTLNGEEIAGAAGETCAAVWRRGGYDTPDVYTCTAIYDVYGTEVEGEPVSCQVSRIPEAFVIVVR